MRDKISIAFVLCMVLAGVTLGLLIAHIVTGEDKLWTASYFLLVAFLCASVAYILEELNMRWNKW